MKRDIKRTKVAKLCGADLVPEFWQDRGEAFARAWEEIPAGVRAKSTAKDLVDLLAFIARIKREAKREENVVRESARVQRISAYWKKMLAAFDIRPSLPQLPVIPKPSVVGLRILHTLRGWR